MYTLYLIIRASILPTSSSSLIISSSNAACSGHSEYLPKVGRVYVLCADVPGSSLQRSLCIRSTVSGIRSYPNSLL
ncbi:hypothetical protein LX36DRAFT_203640 [Colletotrichum falcatum]|nr:hypothetical protein LX36DRAFT_203640 [Colletotrichum falcatum]